MTDRIKEKILALDSPAPRYTSYPSAPSFKPGFSENTYKAWLEKAGGRGPLSLYIHIPFCARLCYYCGCHTFIANGQTRIDGYLNDLRAEAALIAATLKQRQSIAHLHFGGGSPTILKPAAFARLMKYICVHFNIADNAEIAVEADPRQMSEARIASFAANGVNRISLGVQDFDETVMRGVNRPQSFAQTWDAMRLCRDYGIDRINFDLMYGLPGQTVETVRRTVETAVLLNPGRIAFFGYAHVPWMKKHMVMMQALPDASQRFDMYEAGSAILTSAGYVPVGIDHFARPEDSMAQAFAGRTLRRNFQGYTTDMAVTLIGLGASSIGRFYEGYQQNTADLRLYGQAMAEGKLPVNRGLATNSDDRVRGQVISDLMCYMEAVPVRTAALHGFPPDYFATCLAALEPLCDAGLATVDGGIVRVLHPHAARLAARAFDHDAPPVPQAGRHSKVV